MREGLDLFVVADGMGGHEAGEVASEMAVETLCRESRRRLADADIETMQSDAFENAFEESFQAANNGIKDYSVTLGNDMGTTMVALRPVWQMVLISDSSSAQANRWVLPINNSP